MSARTWLLIWLRSSTDRAPGGRRSDSAIWQLGPLYSSWGTDTLDREASGLGGRGRADGGRAARGARSASQRWLLAPRRPLWPLRRAPLRPSKGHEVLNAPGHHHDQVQKLVRRVGGLGEDGTWETRGERLPRVGQIHVKTHNTSFHPGMGQRENGIITTGQLSTRDIIKDDCMINPTPSRDVGLFSLNWDGESCERHHAHGQSICDIIRMIV